MIDKQQGKNTKGKVTRSTSDEELITFDLHGPLKISRETNCYLAVCRNESNNTFRCQGILRNAATGCECPEDSAFVIMDAEELVQRVIMDKESILCMSRTT